MNTGCLVGRQARGAQFTRRKLCLWQNCLQTLLTRYFSQSIPHHRRIVPVGNKRLQVGGELRATPRRDLLAKKVLRRIPFVKNDIIEGSQLTTLFLDGDDFEQKWGEFTEFIDSRRGEIPMNKSVWDDYGALEILAIDKSISHQFFEFLLKEQSVKSSAADLRHPTEWFPKARELRRAVHLHVGPTNSGKTYQALKRLEAAESGVYGGPLRLLAHEIYTRMNAKGVKCALITGEERRIPEVQRGERVPLQSCTVEMFPISQPVDVAVIDEIQMIGNKDRGWAWTQAFLGARAKEVHLCGEERTVPLIKELVALTGDTLEIHQYERLSPLKMMNKSLNGDLRGLRKGDCIICFTVVGIHRIKSAIESVLGKKAAIVYGSLPPETRAQQARLFNDPASDYDFLVASDAVGMGLNLSIKRIIFESTHKSIGRMRVPLEDFEIKQIAGRAGRYRAGIISSETELKESNTARFPILQDNARKLPSPDQKTYGLVTTIFEEDLKIVAKALVRQPEPISSAGLLPPATIIERFATYFPPGTPFAYLLRSLLDKTPAHKRYHLCEIKNSLILADAIESVQLTTIERVIFTAAPIKFSDAMHIKLFRSFAKCVEQNKKGDLLDFPELNFHILDSPASGTRKHLEQLIYLHQAVVLYLWLSYRFTGVFTTRALAFHVRDLIQEAIEKTLALVAKPDKIVSGQLLTERRQREMRPMKQRHAGVLRFHGPTESSQRNEKMQDKTTNFNFLELISDANTKTEATQASSS